MHSYKVLRVIQFVHLMSFSWAREEPRCSKYDFEEKVLEKLVRVEFQFERFKMDFAEAVAEMKGAKNDNEQYKNAIDGKIASMKEIYNSTGLEHQINETLEKQIKELNSIKEKVATPSILFKARALEKTTVLQGDTFVFKNVFEEHGKGYNHNDGNFVVPISGTYMFGVTLCLSTNGCVVGIVVDNTNILVEHLYENGGNICFSYSTTAVLSKGQSVLVTALPGYSSCTIDQSEDYKWNTFYGVLIHG